MIISSNGATKAGTSTETTSLSPDMRRILFLSTQRFEKDTFLVNAEVPRFGSGEAKGIISESVRGKDLYVMVDVCNYSVTYSLTGNTNHMSPDDHFQNLKRIIAEPSAQEKFP